ncbi:MAG: hypothetical protein MUE41_04255 [Gemmatimonadaceae bacterium]|nr:hypothetical protein [Gemmatimonadaceae bacterium]
MAGGSPVDVPLASLTALRVSRGHSRRVGLQRGLLWGGAIGAVVGAVPIVAACSGDSGDCDAFLATAIPAGAATGALLGTAIGAAIGAERWERLPLPAQVSFAPSPGRGISVSVRVVAGRR